MIIKQKAMKRS